MHRPGSTAGPGNAAAADALRNASRMRGAGTDDGERAALEALARRADGIRLPPLDLPGWSSLCAGEYRVCVVGLALELAGLRLALAAARLTGW